MTDRRNSFRRWLQRLATHRPRRRIGAFESLESRRTLSVSVSFADLNTNGESSPFALVSTSLGVVFSAFTPAFGREIYITDGTTAGTRMIRDIEPGATSSFPATFVEMNGIIYFTAITVNSGSELWRTDGTEFGTYQVAEIRRARAVRFKVEI